MDVYLGERFKSELKNYPKEDQNKIVDFLLHVKEKGFSELVGRNKPSDDVPTDDPQWLKKVSYAQKYNLWHYHIGIPEYDTSGGIGNYTSKYILHYIKGDGFIKIVDMTEHPPFNLPSDSYVKDN